MPELAMPTNDGTNPEVLARRFQAIRALTEALIEPLSDADSTAQSMPDASPAKWHMAHTTWFFETFLLRDRVPGYQLHDPRWQQLFNSYYEAECGRIARGNRGLLTRPTLSEVIEYRRRVDDAIVQALPMLTQRCPELVELGLNHEQQHQELLLMDIKHLFFCNPLGPPVWPNGSRGAARAGSPLPLLWRPGPSDLVRTGHDGPGFAFDCEMPVHQVFIAPFDLADRTVSNREWLEFIADGGYRTASLWLSDGWDWLRRDVILDPLYWREQDGVWHEFTLSGWQLLDPAAPVCHVSYYEAEAFASWAGARLPSEAEWEAAVAGADPQTGNQLDNAGPVAPQADHGRASLFGNVWEWTGSAFRPYPGFRPARGAVGEYNGKFMSGQMVLKGGSCATPRGHLRASYRNFFYPHQRWQFAGLRLARDA